MGNGATEKAVDNATKKTIEILSEFNDWRRGVGKYKWSEDPAAHQKLPFSPEEIGLAIDNAVRILRDANPARRTAISQEVNMHMKKIIKSIVAAVKRLFSKNKASSDAHGEISPSTATPPKIDKTYGGFIFQKAVEDKSAQIEGLKLTKNGMSYSWKKGSGLHGWGLAPTDAKAIAVLAVRKAGETKFSGGKFDWISQSRKTRDFKNIKTGYGGWPKNAVDTAKEVAFCIVSSNGKKRTNWIYTSK